MISDEWSGPGLTNRLIYGIFSPELPPQQTDSAISNNSPNIHWPGRRGSSQRCGVLHGRRASGCGPCPAALTCPMGLGTKLVLVSQQVKSQCPSWLALAPSTPLFNCSFQVGASKGAEFGRHTLGAGAYIGWTHSLNPELWRFVARNHLSIDIATD